MFNEDIKKVQKYVDVIYKNIEDYKVKRDIEEMSRELTRQCEEYAEKYYQHYFDSYGRYIGGYGYSSSYYYF